MTDIVSCSDLRRVYGEGEAAVQALRGVTLRFPAGQFTAIMGPSGSGKSTLMHLLAGLDTPSGGSVTVDGREIGGLNDKALTNLRRDRLGLRLPVVQPRPGPHGRGEHHAAAHARGAQGRPRVARRPDRQRRPGRPPHPPPGRALRRPAAARRDRPRAGPPARRRVRRRADRQLGHQRLRGGARPAAPRRRPAWPDRRHGHPRRPGGLADRIVVLRDGEVVHDGGGESTEGVLDLMKAVA